MSNTAGNWEVLLQIVYDLAYVWCASYFLKVFLQGRRREAGVYGGLLFCSLEALAFFLEREEIPYIVYAICSHGALIGLALAVFKGEREKKLFSALLLTAMSGFMFHFIESFFICIGLIVTYSSTGGKEVILTDVWAKQFIQFMTRGIEIYGIYRFSKLLSLVFKNKRKSWYLYTSAIFFWMIFVMDLVNWGASNGILVQNWEKYGLFENQLFSHTAMCIFTGLVMVAGGACMLGMIRAEHEEIAADEYRRWVMFYQRIEEEYLRLECLRHDWKNHMLAVESLVDNMKWDEALDYLKGLEDALEMEFGEEITGNLAVDALLCSKRKQAVKQGIHWQCDARLPKDCPIREIHLCIIVGNILDNALEECVRLLKKGESGEEKAEGMAKEMPSIQVNMGTVKKCLLLEVKNSTDLTAVPENGKSRKKNPGVHGLGLRNIRAAAAEYNGTVHMEVENQMFIISVLLPLSSLCDGICSER